MEGTKTPSRATAELMNYGMALGMERWAPEGFGWLRKGSIKGRSKQSASTAVVVFCEITCTFSKALNCLACC
jgi:hypothetical protein